MAAITSSSSSSSAHSKRPRDVLGVATDEIGRSDGSERSTRQRHIMSAPLEIIPTPLHYSEVYSLRPEVTYMPAMPAYSMPAPSVQPWLVPEIKDGQSIEFEYSPTRRRCVPIGHPDDNRYGDHKTQRYTSLSDCRDAHRDDKKMTLPLPIQQIIANLVPRKEFEDPTFALDLKIEIPTVFELYEQSKDVAEYYRDSHGSPSGRSDLVLYLLKQGYGTWDLSDLITQLVQKKVEEIVSTDYQIFNLIVNHPSWLSKQDSDLRLSMLMWGYRNLVSLYKNRQIDLEGVKQGIQLLTKNVFPIRADDFYNSMGQVFQLNLDDFMEPFTRGVGGLTRVEGVPNHLIDYLINSIIDKFALMASDARHDEVVEAIAHLYDDSVCQSYTRDKDLYSKILDLIDSRPEFASAEMKELASERKLQQLMDQLSKLITHARGGDAKEYDRLQQQLLQLQIDLLIRLGTGRCFSPSEAEGVDLSLKKRIVRPFIKMYGKATRQGVEAKYKDDMGRKRVELLLQKPTQQDIDELTGFITSLDPSLAVNQSLFSSLDSYCNRNAVDCAPIAGLIASKLRRTGSP